MFIISKEYCFKNDLLAQNKRLGSESRQKCTLLEHLCSKYLPQLFISIQSIEVSIR